MVYMQICQPFQNSNGIYSILQPIILTIFYIFRYVVHTFENISVSWCKITEVLPGFSVLKERGLRRL